MISIYCNNLNFHPHDFENFPDLMIAGSLAYWVKILGKWAKVEVILFRRLRWLGIWVPFQYKYPLVRCRSSYYRNETVVRPSYLYNENPFTGETSLYWDHLVLAITSRLSLGMFIFGNVRTDFIAATSNERHGVLNSGQTCCLVDHRYQIVSDAGRIFMSWHRHLLK